MGVFRKRWNDYYISKRKLPTATTAVVDVSFIGTQTIESTSTRYLGRSGDPFQDPAIRNGLSDANLRPGSR